MIGVETDDSFSSATMVVACGRPRKRVTVTIFGRRG
jgi:hypothetical protein